MVDLFLSMDDVIESSKLITQHLSQTKKSTFRSRIRNLELELLENVAKVSYGLGQPPEKDDDGVAVIRATDIKSGHINDDAFLKVNRAEIPPGKNVELTRGDIIIVRSGAYTGDLAMIPSHLEGCIAGYDLVIRPDRNKVDPIFLAEYLLDDAAQAYFKRESIRSAQPHLNSKQVLKTKKPKLEISVQSEIAKELTAFYSLIESANSKTTKSIELKRNIINQVF